MQTLYLLRHAETTANAAGTLQGRLDFPLSDRGSLQAQAIGSRLVELEVQRVLCSPAKRVHATLEPARELGLAEPVVVDDLNEIDLGEAAGLQFEQFLEQYGESIDRKAYERGEYRFPGGESRRDLYVRASRAWEWIEQLGHERVLVASHGGILSQLLAVVLGIENDGWIRFRLDNAALAKLVWHNGRPFLSRLNDREHLPAAYRSPVFAPPIAAMANK